MSHSFVPEAQQSAYAADYNGVPWASNAERAYVSWRQIISTIRNEGVDYQEAMPCLLEVIIDTHTQAATPGIKQPIYISMYWFLTALYDMIGTMTGTTQGELMEAEWRTYRGYPVKRALSAMRKHGG